MHGAWPDVDLTAGTPDNHRLGTQDADRVVVVAFDAPATGFEVPKRVRSRTMWRQIPNASLGSRASIRIETMRSTSFDQP